MPEETANTRTDSHAAGQPADPAVRNLAHALSIEEPAAFWGEHLDSVDWVTRPQVVLDDTDAPSYRWFTDGRLNTCHNAVDRHVAAGRGDQAAVIYDSPITGTKRTMTYRDLLRDTAAFGGYLQSVGVQKGDRVLIYMPMVPEAVVAMLACARIGAVHSVVFGGFASRELAARIDDAEPKVIVSATCGIEPTRIVEYQPLLERALEMSSHTPDERVVLQREQLVADLAETRCTDWQRAMAIGAAQPAEPETLASTDPLYILYTSGSTGAPKGIVRDNGGHAMALLWSLRNVFALEPGEVWWSASDIGWVVGHSYIVYGPLLLGATTVLYEGKPVGTPDAGAFWRVIAEHEVTVLFTAPTAVRAIRKDDPDGAHIRRHNISSLRHLFLAGERLDPETHRWATEQLRVPVVDNWWQTETGWPIAANLRGLAPTPIKPGSPSMPVPGYDVQILAEDGTRLPPGEEGAIAIQLPLPPGTLLTVWGDQERYRTSYLTAYEGYYLSGDSGYLDQDGYLFVMGRSDDVMNVAGHRLSSGAIEAVIAQHPAVAEGAVISLPDPVKGERPCGLVVLKSGARIDRGQLASELIAAVRAQIGPVADLKQIQIVEALPKTRSGKILRKTMRDLARGLAPGTPSTIENPEVLTAIAPVLYSLTVEGGPAPRAPEQSGGSVTSSQWHSVTDPQGR